MVRETREPDIRHKLTFIKYLISFNHSLYLCSRCYHLHHHIGEKSVKVWKFAKSHQLVSGNCWCQRLHVFTIQQIITDTKPSKGETCILNRIKFHCI